MSLGIIPVTSPQPRSIITPILSEKLPFLVERKAFAMPSGQKNVIDNAFKSKLQALAMIFAQKKGIGNDLDICPRFVKIVNNYS